MQLFGLAAVFASDGPNWSRLVALVGLFVGVVVVREVVITVVDARHRHPDPDPDSDGTGPAAEERDR